MPGGYSEAASRVLTMLEETWQDIRARHPEIPPVVVVIIIIIASGTTGTLTRILLDASLWRITAIR